jgi:hypothetical protein
MWDRFADVGTKTGDTMCEKYGYKEASLMLQSPKNITVSLYVQYNFNEQCKSKNNVLSRNMYTKLGKNS